MSQTTKSRRPSAWEISSRVLRFFKPNRAGLVICVLLPTLLATIYYGMIAADIYVSESAFSVRMEQGNSAAEMSSAMPNLFPSMGQQDQLTVNAYVHSRGAVQALQERMDLLGIYRSDRADTLARLSDKVSQEQLLKYFRRMVTVVYDERALISSMQVRAFTAEEAQRLNEALLEEAETFVNGLSEQMREDDISFAAKQLKEAEADLLVADQAMAEFRTTNRNFDPLSASTGTLSLTQTLQGKLVEKRTQLAAARGVMTGRNQYVRNLEREIAALERQIDEQVNVLTEKGPGGISTVLQQYNTLFMNHKFANKRYEMALVSLEGAEIKANRKSIYLTRITAPSLPEEAVEPRRLYRIFSVFFLSMAAYGMALLIAASIGDHIRK